MKKIGLYFICIFGFGYTHAQQVLMSSQININNKFTFSKIIGENQYGLYILRFRDYNLQKEFAIDRYTSDLNLIQTQLYQMEKKEEALKFILADSEIHVITKAKKVVSHYSIQCNLNSINKKYPDYNLPNDFAYYKSVSVEYSPSKNWVAISIPFKNQNGNLSIDVIRHHLSDSIQQIYLLDLQNSIQNTEIENTAVDDMGRYSAVYSSQKNKFGSDKREFYWILPFARKPLNKTQLLNPFSYIQHVKLKYHPTMFQFAVLSLYNFQNEEGAQGLAIFWESKQGKGLHLPFQPDLVKQLAGSKMAEEKGQLNDMFIRNIVPNASFGFSVVLEQYYINKEFETFMVNGMPQTGTNTIYNYNDIVILQTDSNQNMQWNKSIRKKQTSMGNHTYFSSYLFMATNANLSFLYNESAKIDNRLLLVVVNKDGEHNTKVLLENTADIMQAIPVEGKQVTYNSFVLPVQIGKGINLMKVVFP